MYPFPKKAGLYINQSTTNSQGLFGCISEASIKNVTVEGSVIGLTFVCGIVGYASDSYITNCHNAVTVTSNGNYVGGIVGEGSYTYVINCSNECNINASSTSTYSYGVGGIVGKAQSSKIDNCYSVGAMKTSYVGAVVGYIPSTSYYTAYNCYWANDITGSAADSAFGDKCTGDYYSGTDMTSTAMQNQDFVDELNSNAAAYNASYPGNDQACAWKLVDGGFPILDFGVTPVASDN